MRYPYSIIGEIQLHLMIALAVATFAYIVYSIRHRMSMPFIYIGYLTVYYTIAVALSYAAYNSSLRADVSNNLPVVKTMNTVGFLTHCAVYILIPSVLYSLPAYHAYKYLSFSIKDNNYLFVLNAMTLLLMLTAAVLDLLRWRTAHELMGVAGRPQLIYTEYAICWHLKYHYMVMILPFVITGIAKKLFKPRPQTEIYKPRVPGS